MSSLPITHYTLRKSAYNYNGEGVGMRNHPNAMVPIQDIDIDARHGSLLHLRRLPTHLHTCSRPVIPVVNPDKDRPDLYSQHR